MEDDKKRKKNKKKKNKQSKAKEDNAVEAEEKASSDQKHSPEQDAPMQISEKAFAPDNISGNSNGVNGDMPISDAERSEHGTNGREAVSLIFDVVCLVVAENEKKHWVQREASLEETVNQPKAEKDTLLRKAARLEMRVVELEHEKESLLLKQVSVEGTISQLVSEKTSAIAKQASLEERIGQLMEDKALLSSKHVYLLHIFIYSFPPLLTHFNTTQAELEERIKHLERDEDLQASKEAKLEETIKSLEMDRESWILKQSLIEEMIANLRDNNARLQNQVEELEESKIRALQENQMLLVNMSGLQVHLQNSEALYASAVNGKENSEIHVLNSQIEAASNLIEKLVTENADLVEKVNKLYAELNRRGNPSEISSTLVPLPDISVATDDGTVSDNAPESNESLDINKTGFEKVHSTQAVNNGQHDGKLDYSAVLDVPITIDSGEIVQIPLSESESQDAEGQQTTDEDEDSPVELSDAPLTGAPIRFISFVARYVSGADLVNKNPTNLSK
ncbi:unnamed protein product [Rhodiola kirilowii]